MDQDNKIKTEYKGCKAIFLEQIKKPSGKMVVAMMMIFIVIAILLIQGYVESKMNDDNNLLKLDTEEVFVESDDYDLNNFINGYFEARAHLDFVNIYRAFDKDYLILKDTDEGKRFDNGILYEKNFVSGYSDIKIYKHNGIENNETVALVTYNMNFYFSNEAVPSMIVGYIKNDEKKMYFKENLDIGESKYISSLMELSMVKTMYNDTKSRLEILLTSDNQLKLAYNSLRQYDMNPNNDVLKDKDMLVEKIFGTDNKKEEELINLARKKEAIDEEK